MSESRVKMSCQNTWTKQPEMAMRRDARQLTACHGSPKGKRINATNKIVPWFCIREERRQAGWNAAVARKFGVQAMGRAVVIRGGQVERKEVGWNDEKQKTKGPIN